MYMKLSTDIEQLKKAFDGDYQNLIEELSVIYN